MADFLAKARDWKKNEELDGGLGGGIKIRCPFEIAAHGSKS